MARNKKEPEIIEPTGQLYVEPLEKVLHTSMLPYAEFVILDRALPRVEDGLKPVQRRILYTMNEMGLTPDKPHKRARVSSGIAWVNTNPTAIAPFTTPWCVWRRILTWVKRLWTVTVTSVRSTATLPQLCVIPKQECSP